MIRTMSTLLMVRHAESTANAEFRYNRSDDEPLTELGWRQARAAGYRLAERYRPAHLYCSHMCRARLTADAIAAEVGLPVVEIAGIEERHFGELRGKPWAVYREMTASLKIEELWHHRAPGGESLVDVALRAAPVLTELADRHPGEQVIVVSHGGVMAALRAWIAGTRAASLAPPANPQANSEGAHAGTWMKRGTWAKRPTRTGNADGFRLDRNRTGWRPPQPLFDPP